MVFSWGKLVFSCAFFGGILWFLSTPVLWSAFKLGQTSFPVFNSTDAISSFFRTSTSHNQSIVAVAANSSHSVKSTTLSLQENFNHGALVLQGLVQGGVDKKNSIIKPVKKTSCVTNPHFVWSQAVLDQWHTARHLLAQDTLEESCDVQKVLEAYLSGHAEWLGLTSSNFGGVYHTPRGFCEATVNGIRLRYVRVYKAGNNAICANLNELDDGSIAVSSFNFSFVRPPLDHFVSGYSEIEFRSRSHPTYQSSLYNWKRVNTSDAPEAFIKDLVAGRFHRVRDITDVHVFPQVAFLSDVRLNFLGELNNLEEAWALLGDKINQKEWPEFNAGLGHHDHTDAKSHFAPREAMQRLLFRKKEISDGSPNIFREAVCRILLPDFVCFGYELPSDCSALIGDHGVNCAFRYPSLNT